MYKAFENAIKFVLLMIIIVSSFYNCFEIIQGFQFDTINLGLLSFHSFIIYLVIANLGCIGSDCGKDREE
jgi:hypothetical protein